MPGKELPYIPELRIDLRDEKIGCKLVIIAIISVFLIFSSSIINAQGFPTPWQFPNFYGPFSNPSIPLGGYKEGYWSSSYSPPYRVYPYSSYPYSYGGAGYPSSATITEESERAIQPSDEVLQVEIKDNYGYLLISRDKNLIVKIVNLADPDNPGVVKEMVIDGFHSFSRLHLQGNHLFWMGLTPAERQMDNSKVPRDMVGVLDISDPSHPQKADSLEIGIGTEYEGTAETFGFFDQNRSYFFYRKIKDRTSGLGLVDLSEPNDLKILFFTEIQWTSEVPAISHIMAKDNLLFLLGEKLYLYDLANPGHPVLVSSLDQGIGSGSQTPAIYGDYLCLPVGRELVLVNIDEPTQPMVDASLELPDPCGRIIIQDNLLYMADSHRHLVVIDLSDPQNPKRLPGFRLPREEINNFGRIRDLAVEGDLMYTTHYYQPFQIWDLSDPEEVKKRGGISLPASKPGTSQSQQLRLSGRLAVTLTREAMEMLSFSKEGGIILFGIPSLDALNRTYGIFDIISPSTDIPEGAYDRPYRRFIIKFPETTDLYQIQEDYEDDPFCVMAEFEYGRPSGTSYSGGYGGSYTSYGGVYTSFSFPMYSSYPYQYSPYTPYQYPQPSNLPFGPPPTLWLSNFTSPRQSTPGISNFLNFSYGTGSVYSTGISQIGYPQQNLTSPYPSGAISFSTPWSYPLWQGPFGSSFFNPFGFVEMIPGPGLLSYW